MQTEICVCTCVCAWVGVCVCINVCGWICWVDFKRTPFNSSFDDSTKGQPRRRGLCVRVFVKARERVCVCVSDS